MRPTGRRGEGDAAEERAGEARPHSAGCFGPEHDFWWNDDFLELLARRWRLERARSLADVGCGVGHWSRLLLRYLAPGATLVGIDREDGWLRQARARLEQAYPDVAPHRAAFVRGDARALPLATGAVDVATCQTVLMHLPDPEQGLAEMARITRPGGLVICVEPNNLRNFVAFDSLASEREVESLVEEFEFWLRFQRGKRRLGEGDYSIGESLPGLFARRGLTDIQVSLRETCLPLFPPYESERQRAILQQEEEWEARRVGPWNYRVVRRCYLAGGGTEEKLAAHVASMKRQRALARAAIRARRYHSAGASVVFVVSGRKP